MKQVWKFPIESESSCFAIKMPKGAIIRSFQTQLVPRPSTLGEPPKKQNPVFTVVRDVEVPTIWAEVDLDGPKDKDFETESRVFCLVGTGHTLPSGQSLEYIGTAQMYQGSLVLHLYEIKEK